MITTSDTAEWIFSSGFSYLVGGFIVTLVAVVAVIFGSYAISRIKND